MKDTMILKDGTTIELEAGASLGAIQVSAADRAAMLKTWGKLTEENLAEVQIQNGSGLTVGNHRDLVLVSETSIVAADGRVNTTYNLREKTDMEKRMDNVEADQAVYGRAAMFSAVSFSDDQAIQVPELYDNWSGDGVSYKVGVRINHNGILYKVLQDHTSQPDWTPDTAPSLYDKVLVADPEVIPEWEQPDSTNGYAKGDKVIHNGTIWESLVDNNVWEPGAMGTESLWKEVTMVEG